MNKKSSDYCSRRGQRVWPLCSLVGHLVLFKLRMERVAATTRSHDRHRHRTRCRRRSRHGDHWRLQGLSDAQNKALSPLNSVGTDIIVTRTVAPTLSTATTTTTTPANRIRRRRRSAAAAAAAAVDSSPAAVASSLNSRDARRARCGQLLGDHGPGEARAGRNEVHP